MSERITVLVVDDSRLFRTALEQALGGQPDISVVGSVFSGAKALEFIRATPPHVVTLDVEMPGMDGLATLKQIQSIDKPRPASEAVGVIMVSAFTRRGVACRKGTAGKCRVGFIGCCGWPRGGVVMRNNEKQGHHGNIGEAKGGCAGGMWANHLRGRRGGGKRRTQKRGT